MPIDASIPLQVKPPGFMTPQQMMSLQQVAQQTQMNQMQMQDMQQERAEKNALRTVMADPSIYDPKTGQVSQEGLRKIYQVSPKQGLVVQQNMLKSMQEQSAIEKNRAQAEHFKEQSAQARTKMKEGEVKVADHVQAGALNVYNDMLPKVGEERARAAAEEFRREELEKQSKLGIVSPEFIQMGGSKPFDPVKAKAWVDASKPAGASTETPFMKELKATGVAPGSPEWNRQLQKHLDKLDAPARTTVNMATADEMLPPETLNFMARQALRGDMSVMQNIGRGKQGSKNIAALRNEMMKVAKEEGISPEEMAARNAEFFGIKAGERTLGTRTAQVGMAVSEARQMVPLALEASEAATRTGAKSLNDIQQAVQKGTASPELRRFVAANNSLVNVYARAISPTGVPTISDKDHAREVLSVAFTKGDYRAGVEQLEKEMVAAQRSPGMVRQEFREAVTGKGEATSPGDVKSMVEGTGQKYEPEKYEYRIGPNGNVQRRAKGGR